MALREITDRFGRAWRVWEVRPGEVSHDFGYARAWTGRERRVTVRERYRLGWLTFECGRERRRVVPIPQGWEALADESLHQLCVQAEPVEHVPRLM
jgi:hypothetical protein